MGLIKAVKQLFCNHSYADSQLVTCRAENGDYLLMNRCTKCRKPIVIRMKATVLDRIIERDIQELLRKREGE